VRDARLAHATDYKGLNFVNVTKTKVTAKSVAELAKALPNCKITHNDGVIEPKK
jgi:hypothetical protein